MLKRWSVVSEPYHINGIGRVWIILERDDDGIPRTPSEDARQGTYVAFFLHRRDADTFVEEKTRVQQFIVEQAEATRC